MIKTNSFTHPTLRRISALVWTALALVTLLQSSGHPVIGPAAPPGPPSLERELLLTTGHIVVFSILTALWWWALSASLNAYAALVLAVVIALVLGTLTEIGQAAMPDRTASWEDLAVNWLVTFVTAWFIRRCCQAMNHPANTQTPPGSSNPERTGPLAVDFNWRHK